MLGVKLVHASKGGPSANQYHLSVSVDTESTAELTYLDSLGPF